MKGELEIMYEVANTQETGGLWTQDPELVSAAWELRTYTMNAAMNLLQIGRKLAEVKPKVPHGEWEEYVTVNTHMSMRTAQQYIQAYKEFGFDSRIAELGGSQLIRLLPMSPEEREELLSRNDVKGMSVREMDAAIRKIRKEEEARHKAEMDAAIQEERTKAREALEAERASGRIQLARAKEAAEAEKEKAVEESFREAKETVNKAWNDARAKIEEATARAEAAEKAAFEADSRPPEVVRETAEDPELLEALRKSREEIERLAEANRTMMENARAWSLEKAEMQRELDENDDIIREQQGALNEAQNELLNLKSAQKRGEDRTDGGGLTLDLFESAVREFIGICSPMPLMGLEFSQMGYEEKNRYFILLKTVEKWADGARTAIETMGGGVTIE